VNQIELEYQKSLKYRKNKKSKNDENRLLLDEMIKNAIALHVCV
jgi:hypothetical protein